ncbi:zinc ribbon-containing protein [Anaerovirgula multivorans]|uniref:zinc ribbon-containing protein n=1 Tax=Anaerovirgula multivorans TaxID=312168 RepID=UPI000B77EA61
MNYAQKSRINLLLFSCIERKEPIGSFYSKGTYICKKCGQRVVLDDHTDTLPPCPKCYHTEYRKA